MKILLLSPNQSKKYNWGHQLFRNEIGNHEDVLYYGSGYKNFDENLTAPEIIDKYGPFDILLTYGLRYTLPFKDIGKVDIPKFHIVIDLFPPKCGYKGSIEKYKSFVENNKYDGYFYRQMIQKQYLDKMGLNNIPSFWLPFSVDINKYRKQKVQKKYDILTSSTQRIEVYPNRTKVNKLVNKMGLTSIQKRIVHNSYIKAINQSKICIISTNIFNSPNMKFTEFISCGSFVLSDKPDDFNELGFKDREHLVLYKDLNDLEDKIKYFLKHDKEREEIALNGMKFVRENHNNTIRVKFLIDKMNEIIK